MLSSCKVAIGVVGGLGELGILGVLGELGALGVLGGLGALGIIWNDRELAGNGVSG